MGVEISEDVLNIVGMTPEEFLVEMAVHLYDIEKLSMEQARRMAQLDQLSFQQELSTRNVFIKYDVQDFMEDLETLKALEEK